MKQVVFLSVVASLAAATPLSAQFGQVDDAPRQWVTGWVGGYLDPGTVRDFRSRSEWAFGSTLAAGAGIHRRVGSNLMLGLEAGYSPAKFERRDLESNDVVDSGSAKLLTTMATARLRYGGADAFSMYLTGGVGAFTYAMPDPVDRWDPDLALMTGAGLEYRPSGKRALFVEWGRYWTFHDREGVEDNTVKHSQFRIGVRTGW